MTTEAQFYYDMGAMAKERNMLKDLLFHAGVSAGMLVERLKQYEERHHWDLGIAERPADPKETRRFSCAVCGYLFAGQEGATCDGCLGA